MLKRGDPKVLKWVVRSLRFCAGMSQEDFGRATSVDQNTVSQYELGNSAPPGDVLRRMAGVAGLPWPVVVHMRRFYAAALALSARDPAPRAGEPLAPEILDVVLAAVTPYLVEEALAEAEAEVPSPEEQLRQAAQMWETLEGLPPDTRRRLINTSPYLAGNHALASVIREASDRAAGHEETVAAELADLAWFTAGGCPVGGVEVRETEAFSQTMSAARAGSSPPGMGEPAG